MTKDGEVLADVIRRKEDRMKSFWHSKTMNLRLMAVMVLEWWRGRRWWIVSYWIGIYTCGWDPETYYERFD
ncbi:hypothetical protein AHAS_Ahas15G0357900 [Arachis hypogaea]